MYNFYWFLKYFYSFCTNSAGFCKISIVIQPNTIVIGFFDLSQTYYTQLKCIIYYLLTKVYVKSSAIIKNLVSLQAIYHAATSLAKRTLCRYPEKQLTLVFDQLKTTKLDKIRSQIQNKILVEINIRNSIEKKKVIDSSKLSYLWEYIVYGSLPLFFLFAIIVETVQPTTDETKGAIFLLLLLSIAIFPITFYNLLNMDKLSVVPIIDGKKAKQRIIKLIETKNWDLREKTDELLIFETKRTSPRERIVTIIFKEDDLYINTMSYGKSIRSVFYFNSDKRFTQSIIDDLKSHNVVKD